MKRVRSYQLPHAALGQAWAEYAIAHQRQNRLAAAEVAWDRALRFIPAESPWAQIVAEQVLATALRDQVAWQVLADPSAQRREQIPFCGTLSRR